MLKSRRRRAHAGKSIQFLKRNIRKRKRVELKKECQAELENYQRILILLEKALKKEITTKEQEADLEWFQHMLNKIMLSCYLGEIDNNIDDDDCHDPFHHVSYDDGDHDDNDDEDSYYDDHEGFCCYYDKDGVERLF